MGAAGLVVLVVFNILCPEFAPDLNENTFADMEFDEHERLLVAGVILVGEIIV